MGRMGHPAKGPATVYETLDEFANGIRSSRHPTRSSPSTPSARRATKPSGTVRRVGTCGHPRQGRSAAGAPAEVSWSLEV